MENNFGIEKTQLERQINSGGGWFITIAVLSMINTVILLFGGQWNFIVGLGVTTISSVLGNELGTVGKSIAFVFSLIAAGIFVVFGLLSKKKYKWAFIIGMVLYAMDGLMLLLIQDWLSMAFHGYALFNIYSGLSAVSKLKKLEETQVIVSTPIG